MSNTEPLDYSNIRSLSCLVRYLQETDIPQNQYWTYIKEYQEFKARKNGIPLTGILELTPFCNLDCKMCYVHPQGNRIDGKSLISVGKWKDLVDQAHKMGMLYTTLTGGECLTYPGFNDVYLYLRKKGIKATIKTNGILLNKDRIRFLVEYPPRSIIISVYGSNNEAYKAVTGHAAFDTVYNNLCLLKETNIPVMLCITPSKYMLPDIENLIQLVNQLGFRYIINYALFPSRDAETELDCDLTTEEYVELLKLQKRILSSKAIPTNECELPDFAENSRPKLGISCGAGMSSFTINWDGQMTGCDSLRGPYISVIDNPFSIAWSFIHEAALNYLMPSECDLCRYRKVCFSCAAIHQLDGEIGHCNRNVCERTKQLVKAGILTL